MSLIDIVFLFLYLVHFFVPGYCLLTILNFQRHIFFLSLSISYAIHNGLLLICVWSEAPVFLFTFLSTATTAALLILGLLSGNRLLPLARITYSRREHTACNSNSKAWTLGSCDLFLFGVITIVMFALGS